MEAPDMVSIAHALPRRVRLAAPRLAWHREACARIAREVAAEGAYARVTVRPATGSVIVEGEEDALAPEALQEKLEALLRDARDEEGRPLAEPGPEHRPSPTRVAHALAHAFACINADVRAALDERADLGTILPAFFAAAGFAKLATSGDVPVPSWFNLLWWSLRSFMTFNLEAVMEEERAPAAEEAARRDLAGEM